MENNLSSFYFDAAFMSGSFRIFPIFAPGISRPFLFYFSFFPSFFLSSFSPPSSYPPPPSFFFVSVGSVLFT